MPSSTWRLTALLVFATSALFALTLLALRKAFRIAHLPLAAVWISIGLWAVQSKPAPSPQTALLGYADGLSRTVRGTITRVRPLPANHSNSATYDYDPDQWDEPGIPALSLDLHLSAVEEVTPDTSRMIPMEGGVRATVVGGNALLNQLRCGDVIEAPLRLRIPDRYRDPGVWEYADYLLDQGASEGIAATSSLPGSRLHVLAGAHNASALLNLRCTVHAVQTWAADRLLEYTRSAPNRHLPTLLRLDPDDAGMLNAMLFGDRSRLSRQLRLGFERTGSFHLFVVSGMHVALLAGALFWLGRRLRLAVWLSTLLTVGFTSGYAVLTGFGVPIQRALLMTSVFLIARLLSRQPNSPNALGAAALVILVWSPRALFESSFQMTFLAVVAIAGIAMPLGERSFLSYARAAGHLDQRWRDTSSAPALAQFRVMLRLWGGAFAYAARTRKNGLVYMLPATLLRTLLWAAELSFIGLVAEAVMVLPMALYFHRVTVFALPANMLSIPLVALLAPLAVATFCASLLSPLIATLPGIVTALLLHGITSTIARVGRAQSADLRVPGPALAAVLAALCCFAFCCWAARRSRRWAWSALFALPVGAVIVLWPEPARLYSGTLEVTAIDVGQGDSLFVVGPTGRTMLVDAGGPTGAAANGENATSSPAFDIGEEVVSTYLWSRRIRSLDIIALTHAHSDHIGGMPAVVRNFRPRELWVSSDPDSDAFRDLLKEAASLHILVRHLRAGDRAAWDSIDFQVLAPAADYTNPGPPVNNDSLVFHLQFGKSSVLLEGDAEAPSERVMLANSYVSAVTLLKVGHHGSRSSTTPEFLALAAPQDAIISVGRHNTFGHPRAEVISRLAAARTRLYRTDEFGLTTFLLDRDGRISALTAASTP